MDNRFLNYAAISAFGISEWMEKGWEIMGRKAPTDTSVNKKERKDRARVLTMIHEKELKGKDRKRRLPRSKRKGCSIPAKSK